MLLALVAIIPTAGTLPAVAYESTTTSVGSDGSQTMAGSGMKVTITGSGNTSVGKPTSPSNLGGIQDVNNGSTYTCGTVTQSDYNASWYSGTGLPCTQEATNVTASTVGCKAGTPCSIGTLTITFPYPVRNPVITAYGVGGAGTYNSGTAVNHFGTQYTLNAGASTMSAGTALTKLSGNAPLTVTGTMFGQTTANTGSYCDGPKIPAIYGATPSSAAACGQIQLTGVVTKASFIATATVDTGTVYSGADQWRLVVTVPQDYGDAPASYDQSDAARAVLSDVTLGPTATQDNPTVLNSASDPNAGASATGDSGDDGVSLSTVSDTMAGSAYSTTVAIAGASQAGTVCGWIDWGGVGTFAAAADKSCTSFAAGATSATLTWTVPSAVNGMGGKTTYARFRIGYDTAAVSQPVGASQSGEVEDYALTIASAQAPFLCNVPTVFNVNSAPSVLDAQYPTAGGSSFTPIGGVSGWLYNSIGYNPADRFIYAVSQNLSPASASYPGGELLRVDAAGTVYDLGTITGLLAADQGKNANVGFFDAAGNYWIAFSTSASLSGDLYRVNLATLAATPVYTTGTTAVGVAPADLTYANGYAWGILNGTIYRYTLPSGTATTGAAAASFTSPAPSEAYGAAWTYVNGNLGFDGNTSGNVVEIQVTNPATTPSFTLVATSKGVATSSNDGTSCGSAANVTVVKTASTAADPKTGATVSASGQIAWTITVTGAGPGYSSGFTLTDAVPAAFTSVAVTGASSNIPGATSANGYGCTVTGQSVSCVEGFGSPGLAPGATATLTTQAQATGSAGTCASNTVTVLGNEQTSGAQSSSVQSCIPQAATVIVTKVWKIVDPAGHQVGLYHLPTQAGDTATSAPAGFSATPTVNATAASWGQPVTGYTVGQSVALAETDVRVPSGCTATGAQLTAANGAAATTALPYTATLTATPQPNTFEITNTVTCSQQLTLVKKIAYGTVAPTDWTLSATGGTGALPGPNGRTGQPSATAVNVTPQTAYTLAEQGTTAADSAYTAAGAWACTTPAGTPVTVTSSKVTLSYGQSATCTITNTTATVTVLKHIDGAGLQASQFTLSLTPQTAGAGLGQSSIAGSETENSANTFEITPGVSYNVSESAASGTPAYFQEGLQVSTDGTNWANVTGTTITPAAGTHAYYRLVNMRAPGIALPLTGGPGTGRLWALGSLLLVASAAIASSQISARRRGVNAWASEN